MSASVRMERDQSGLAGQQGDDRRPLAIGYLPLIGDDDDRWCLRRLETMCDHVLCDDLARTHGSRPGLTLATAALAKGDRLVVHRLSDVGLTIVQLTALLERFGREGIHLLSIDEGIVDGSPLVEALVDVGARLSLMQREVKRSKSALGTTIAAREGRLRGARAALSPEMVATVKKLMSHPTLTMAEIANAVGTSRNTLYRTLKREQKVQ